MAQPLLPEPHERPHPVLPEPQERPHPVFREPQERPHPASRALLPEPPERPVTGPRRVPAFRSRRPAGGRYADGRAGEPADGQTSPLPSRGSGWTVISYFIAGMLAYGGIGWLISRAVHETVIFPVGMLFGLGVSLGLVIYRYGRSSST